MKKSIFFILMLLLLPINAYATNDVSITCNKTKLKINEETTCSLNINNLDFTIIDVTGKVVIGDNLQLISSSYDKNIWLSLDNTFSVTDINLMRHNNDKINKVSIATFKIKASNVANGTSTISFSNILTGNSEYQSISLNCNPININFGNNINTLSSLNIKGFDLNFSSEKTNYNLEIDNENIEIIATATDKNAKITGNGSRKLNYGNNTINIVVTAENGYTKTYTLNITRKDNRSSDNNLLNLKVNAGELKFDKEITEYRINVSNEVENFEITYELSDSKSKADIIGNKELSIGENEFVIKVTAENGTTKEYKIIVIRDKKVEITNSNKASNILIKGYEIPFDQNKHEYTINTNAKELVFDVILEDSNSSYEIVGNNDLKNGSIISIIVTDQDGKNNIYKYVIENSNQEDEINNNSIWVILLIVSISINIFLMAILLIKFKKNKTQ